MVTSTLVESLTSTFPIEDPHDGDIDLTGILNIPLTNWGPTRWWHRPPWNPTRPPSLSSASCKRDVSPFNEIKKRERESGESEKNYILSKEICKKEKRRDNSSGTLRSNRRLFFMFCFHFLFHHFSSSFSFFLLLLFLRDIKLLWSILSSKTILTETEWKIQIN